LYSTSRSDTCSGLPAARSANELWVAQQLRSLFVPLCAAEPLTVDRYSAILVASDTTCGGCDLSSTSQEVCFSRQN
jgi:hypothetical protein